MGTVFCLLSFTADLPTMKCALLLVLILTLSVWNTEQRSTSSLHVITDHLEIAKEDYYDEVPSAATTASATASTTSSPPTLCYSTPFGLNKTSFEESKSKCENYTDGHLWTPTNSHQKQLPIGFSVGGIWTDSSKSSAKSFEWRNKVEVEAFPYSVVADITAARKLPPNFVPGSKTIVGSLIWNGGQPNMKNEALVASPNHNYGVLLGTEKYSEKNKVICQHRCE